jgi:phosphoglycolate phosphatase
MAIKGVIFDLDGTLLDSLDDVANYANAVLLAFGFESRTQEEYRYLAGQGAYNLMASSSGTSDEMLIKEMAEEFKKVYEEVQGSSRPYAGMDDVLDELASHNIKMAVLSNKPDGLTKICTEKYFCRQHFEAVFGQREGESIKPDPAGALEIAKIFGLNPSEIAIVGDTKNDILTAKNGGFYAVGVTWGFRDKEELEAHGADAIINSPQELLTILGL